LPRVRCAFAGFIHLLFPNAKIVHCVRGFHDLLLSNFKYKFEDSGLEFSLRVGDLAAFFHSYREMMRHWEKVRHAPAPEARALSPSPSLSLSSHVRFFYLKKKRRRRKTSKSQRGPLGHFSRYSPGTQIFQVLPGRVLTVQYEHFVAAPEPSMRRLLQWCGLPWEDRVQRFHETERVVHTFSQQQVTRALSHANLAPSHTLRRSLFLFNYVYVFLSHGG
jgi:hypothetical protein